MLLEASKASDNSGTTDHCMGGWTNQCSEVPQLLEALESSNNSGIMASHERSGPTVVGGLQGLQQPWDNFWGVFALC